MQAARQGFWSGDTAVRTPQGDEIAVACVVLPHKSAVGDEECAAGIARDTRARRPVETALHEQGLQPEMTVAQQATQRELSTPLMPIAAGVMVMLVNGGIDGAHAQRLIEALLGGIAVHNARIAILDITGVKVVDVAIALMLIRAARAARLLGAEVVLTGIGPELAQSMAHIGANLREVTTRGSMRQAIAYALEQQSK